MTFSSDPSLNTNQLPISLDINADEQDYQSTLLLYLRRIANAVNTKESGLFLLQEVASFEQWFGSTPQQNRNGYRTTFDLIALNGGAPIGGSFSFVLTSTSQPPIPIGYKYPVQGFGGAIDSAGTSYFLNDPDIYVRYVASTNTITITNTTGNTLSWAVWVMEYLKN